MHYSTERRQMTRIRLLRMMDLVLQCDVWGKSHRVSIEIDNDGDHRIFIFPHVGNGGTSKTYFCDESRINNYDTANHIFDPNFDKAEAKLVRLMKEIGTEVDT